MNSANWHHDLMTIADLGIYGEEEILDLDPAQVAERKRELGFNTEHLTCSDVYGGEKGIFYFQTDIAESVPRDFLAEYLPEAHARGIRVLIYYNVHWMQTEFAMRHPEWLQVERDGEIKEDLYGSGCAPCVNSPWRDWSLRGIRDLARYDIHGIFLDGPIFVPRGCYCDSCQRLFSNTYGEDLPREEDWGSPVWRDFIDFRYRSLARYLEDAGSALKEEKPETVIYMNCTGLSPGWPAARDNRTLMPHQDILGAEGGFLYYDLRTTPLWKPGMCAKLLETQSCGKPTVVFIAGANKGWDEYILPAAETRLLFADTVANGANPWYGIPLHRSDRPGALAAGEMNRFLLENAEYLQNTKPLSRVAMLWSTVTADFYRASVPVTDFTPEGKELERREKAGDFSASFLGCYEALVRSHVPFSIIDEAYLSGDGLSRYDLLLLPNCACLSDQDCHEIEAYVNGGGNLMASFETSLYDEYGSRRDDFGLSKAMGTSAGRGTFGPMKLDYASAVEEDPVLEGLSSKDIPSPIYGMELSDTTARTLLAFRHKMPARYVHLPPISDNPLLTANRLGEGRCLYVAGNLFEHYAQYHNPDYRRIVANSVAQLARRTVELRDCPGSVEVVLRWQPERHRLMVHLINFTAEMTRPMESVVTFRDMDMVLHIPGLPRTATALRSGLNLDLTETDEGSLLRIPEMKEYEVLAIEPVDLDL